MIGCNDSTCPKCGGNLKYYNKVKRISKDKGGNVSLLDIRQMVCEECKSIHRELPDSVAPYRHYNAKFIRAAIKDGGASVKEYKYPCKATIRRWCDSRKQHFLLRSEEISLKKECGEMEDETKKCPYCGGLSKFHHYVGRTVRSEYGKKERIRIKELKCKSCGKMFRDLPSYLKPNKQFRGDIIDGFISNELSIEDLEYEDFPSEQTIKRWKTEHNKK